MPLPSLIYLQNVCILLHFLIRELGNYKIKMIKKYNLKRITQGRKAWKTSRKRVLGEERKQHGREESIGMKESKK